jgi:hypothetical protein
MPEPVILPTFDSAGYPALAPQERLNEAKLSMFLKKMPVEAQESLMSLTWEEAFALAADAEQIRRHMPVWDIAWEKFMGDEAFFLKLAEFLERRSRYFATMKLAHQK